MATSKLWRFVKLSTRLGIVGGTLYVTTEEGLWGTPEESILFYEKVKELVKPGVEAVVSKDQQEQLASTLEKVRVWSDPSHIPVAEKWNSAVVRSVQFIDSLPDYVASGDQSALKTLEEKAKKLIS